MQSDFLGRFAQLTSSLGITARVEPIAAYRSKPDFGDLDVLVESLVFQVMPPRAVVDTLSTSYGRPLPWVKNGSVLSVGLPLSREGECFQLDLIGTPAVEFDFSLGYFSWNDMGNLVGRVAHKMGLKFGHDGLWLPMRDGDNLHDELLVTRDFESALSFLGFDAARWREGFDSLDEIFTFVAAGARFDPELYPLEHRNHTARVRDKKRPVYMGFLRWLEGQPHLSRYHWSQDKAVYLPEITKAFPKLAAEYEHSISRLAHTKAIKACFNGELVARYTGLAGKDLGAFMAYFKREHATKIDGFPQQTAEQIRDLVNESFSRFLEIGRVQAL